MSETLACPECGAKLRPSEHLPPGALVQCPRCSHSFPTPAVAPLSAPGAAGGGQEVDYTPAPPARRADDVDRGAAEDQHVRRDPAAAGKWDDERLAGKGPVRRPRRLEGLSNQYTIDASEWLRLAAAHWGAVLGPMIGFLILSQVIQLLLSAIPVVGGLVSSVVGLGLGAGLWVVALAQLRGRPWTFNDFFTGFQYLGALFVNGLLVGLLVLATAIPAIVAGFVAAGADDDAARAVAIAVAVVAALPAVYVGVRAGSFGQLLIIDRGCEAVEALKGSWALTSGHFWGILGISLLLLLINLLGVLLLIVGVLFTYPLTVLAFAAGYMLIVGDRPVDPSWSQGAEPGPD
jgi:hypothetical protein